MNKDEQLKSLIFERLNDSDPISRDTIIIRSIPKLNEFNLSQQDLQDYIDKLLLEQRIFLTSQEFISTRDDYPFLNIHHLKTLLSKIKKDTLFRDMLSMIRWSLEVSFLRDVVNKEVVSIIAGGEKHVEGSPNLQYFSYKERPHFGLTINIKALLFTNRSFVDKMLLVLNQLNFILKDTEDKTTQPSLDISSFTNQFLDQKLEHLDDEILNFFNEKLTDIVSFRFIRNNLKLGGEFYYAYHYIQGRSFVNVKMFSVKKDDKLIDRLIEMGFIDGSEGGKEIVEYELPAMTEFNDYWMKEFMSIIYRILVRKVILD